MLIKKEAVMNLPVPELEKTMEKYKIWIRPLVSQEEYKKTTETAEKFMAGPGKKLQNYLLEDKKIFTNTSWLDRHWLNSYLDGRDTVSIGSNFAMDLRFGSEEKDTEVFLTEFIFALGSVCKSFKNNSFGKIFDAKNNEISLNQFEILRGSSRIPRKKRDGYNISNNNSDYITIFYKNNLYKIKIWDENYNIADFSDAVSEILNNTKNQEYTLSSICFAENGEAAELRERYTDKNVFFDVLENSLFNISIISREFSSIEEERYYNLYLEGENTWLYKPLNFIYNLKNRKIYINCEHTYQDAGTIIEIARRAFENMGKQDKVCFKAEVLKIEEYFDSEYMEKSQKIKENYKNKIKQFFCRELLLEIDDKHLKGYSKDAVMQFLLQYAQLKTFGEIRGMYEAVDMREYLYGRTECVRSVSMESVEFVKALAEDNSPEEINEKFLLAEKEHKNRIRECKKAEGIDRHLYGLYLMKERLENKTEKEYTENFFKDISYKKVTENFLSTTSTGYIKHMGYLLFTPVVYKGLGITYLKEPEGLKYLISYYISEEKKVKEFTENLKEGLEKLKKSL